MKKITVLLAVFSMSLIATSAEVVPPNMELGHWLTTVDQSAMIEKVLSGVPKESRAMVEKMMEKKMQTTSATEQCVTQKTLENFDEQVKGALSQNKECDFNVLKSTSAKFVAELVCDGSVMHMDTTVINSKRHETLVSTKISGVDTTTITSISEWKSAVCPNGG